MAYHKVVSPIRGVVTEGRGHSSLKIFLDVRGPQIAFEIHRKSDAFVRQKKIILENMILFNYKVKNESVNKDLTEKWNLSRILTLFMTYKNNANNK